MTCNNEELFIPQLKNNDLFETIDLFIISMVLLLQYQQNNTKAIQIKAFYFTTSSKASR